MSLPWFRMYSEWATDPVVQSLAFEDQRHHAVILCLKCNGTIDRDIAREQRERIITRGLGLDPVTSVEVKRRLLEVGLIDENWQPNGWEKRQFMSDVSTNRVRKYRKNKETGNVTGNNGNRFRNGPDTEQIQNRTDTENKLLARRDKRASLGDGEIVEKIPALGNVEVEVKESYVHELDRLYPAVDIPQTLREIRAWNLANTAKRKTPGGVARHINTWMAKVQNGG